MTLYFDRTNGHTLEMVDAVKNNRVFIDHGSKYPTRIIAKPDEPWLLRQEVWHSVGFR